MRSKYNGYFLIRTPEETENSSTHQQSSNAYIFLRQYVETTVQNSTGRHVDKYKMLNNKHRLHKNRCLLKKTATPLQWITEHMGARNPH